MIRFFVQLFHFISKVFDFLTPVGDLAARWYVSGIFLKSGILKLTRWEGTLFLFSSEFNVPLLSPYVAAVLGTAAEIILPVLLIIGLGGRTTIAIFFFYNLVAVLSYPFLWTMAGTQGLQDHITWGLLLTMLMFHGPGKLSVDYWLHKKYGDFFKKQLEQH